MAVERRFLTGVREAAVLQPGLIQDDDGSVWVIGLDGERVSALGGFFSADANGTVTLEPDDQSGDDPFFTLIYDPEEAVQRLADSDDGHGVFFGVLPIGGDLDENFLFLLGARGMDVKAPPGAGEGSVRVSSADTDNRTAIYSGSLVVESGEDLVFRANSEAVFFRSAHAAPDESKLSAGDIALWFDQSDGAPKLMALAKTADGTLVSATVATLTP